MKDFLANAFNGVRQNSPQYVHVVAEVKKGFLQTGRNISATRHLSKSI
jgi:hypothetical protein